MTVEEVDVSSVVRDGDQHVDVASGRVRVGARLMRRVGESLCDIVIDSGNGDQRIINRVPPPDP